ncbi:hypothetical protein [Marinobacter sp. MDS2]|uniref:hypothetical protein n=1 Tax=Marinobacter sp. MDS2 TaxID=3065961 RepID=UPI00273BD4B0|nr:hypothetical protein [Marinobacter sp. MDS2]MDP4546532.1 hypothetical protein [Marinobacter sp. MDS2]
MSNTPETIYLIPGECLLHGPDSLVWSDDPAPDEHCDPAEAVKYVRADVLEQAQAKVAELEEWAAQRPNAHDRDLRIEYARWADGIGPSSGAFILRKQAEAVEVIANKLEGMNLTRPDEFLRSNAQRLRQQADEAEKAGGKK